MEEFAYAYDDWLDDDSMLTMMQGVEESQQEEEVTAVDSQQASFSLTPEQQLVVDLVRKGKNVFFTGSGGTGTTLVLQHILRFLSEKYQEAGDVVITTPTAIAGMTLDYVKVHLGRVSPRVMKFYEALARNEAHSVTQLRFLDLLLDFPNADIVEPGRNSTHSTPLGNRLKCPEEVFLKKLTCYHCNKEGYPAWACTIRDFATDSMRSFTRLDGEPTSLARYWQGKTRLAAMMRK